MLNIQRYTGCRNVALWVPGRCKWAAKGEQSCNVLRTVLQTVQGELIQSWSGERWRSWSDAPTKKKRQNCKDLALY